MGSYVIRIKLLPKEISTEHQAIVDSVAGSLPDGAKLRSHRIEPIAFGLSAVIIDVLAPEEEGAIDMVEKAVSEVPTVGQYELLGVSRLSGKLPG